MKQSLQIHEFIKQLLLAWKATGHHVGVDTHLRLQEIIKAIPDDTDPSKLKTLITPILAENKNQQRELHALIDKLALIIPKPTPKWQKIGLLVFQIIALTLFVAFVVNQYLLKISNKPKINPYIPTQIVVGKQSYDTIDRKSVVQSNESFNAIKSINSSLAEHSKVSIDSSGSTRFKIIGVTPGIDTIPITLEFRKWSELFKENRNNWVKTEKTFYLVVTVFDRQSTEVTILSDFLDSLKYKDYDHSPSIASLALEKIPLFSIKFAYWNWTKIGILLGWIFLLLQLGYLLTLMRSKDPIPSKPDATPLRKRPNDTPPYVLQLEVPQAGQVSRGELITRVIAKLYQRSNAEYIVLDVQRTIKTTIHQAGRVGFRYKSPSRPKEYLWLIDSPSPHDHRAQLFDTLYQEFERNQVLIERFFFHRDVRLCWNEQFPDGISLRELQHRFGEHELFIIGNGDSLISPSSGDLQEWTKIFEAWKSRNFLISRATEQLDQEAQLLSTLFHLAPATLAGLSECFAASESLATDYPSSGKSSFSSAPFIPRLSEQLSPEAVFGALGAEFVEYYPGRTDDRMLKWVASCAISPVLHWDVTLFFGSLVDDYPEDPLLSYVNLEKLTRLDWFTSKGFIPENARKALLKWLEAEHIDLLLKLRLAWKDILEDNLARLKQAAKDLGEPPFENSVAYDDLRMAMIVNELTLDNLRQEKINPEERRQLERELRERKEEGHFDFLALELLAQVEEEHMDLEDQQEAKKTLADYLGFLDNWKWQLPLVVWGFLGIWTYNPNEKEACLGNLVEFRGREYCLNTPQDSLTYLEHVICDTLRDDPFIDTAIANTIQKEIKENYIIYSFIDQLLRDSANNHLILYFQELKIRLENEKLTSNCISKSKFLIRRYNLDSNSFYRNVGKAYWNTGAYHYNAGRIDSACIYFTKLEQWSWRDSVITKEERDLIGKICPLITNTQPNNPGSERNRSTTNDNSPGTVTQDILAPPLSEEDEWAKAIAADNAEAYALYLERFPTGANAAEAQKRLADLVSISELNAWESANIQDNAASYESYLKAYPNGTYAALARQRINDLLDNAAWSKAQKANTPAACQRYLNEFPNGLYREEALKCINPPIAEFKVSEDLKSNVVGIRATLASGDTVSGSGLIVGKRNQQLYIVTPGYLIHEGANAPRQIQVSLYKSPRTYLAREVAWFENDNLSVLKLTEPDGFTWKSNLMDYTPSRSQKVRYIKAGESWTDLNGEIGTIIENKIAISAGNIYGTSGATVCTKKGIIGLIQRTDNDSYQALSIKRIRELLGNEFVNPVKESNSQCNISVVPSSNRAISYKNRENRCEGFYQDKVTFGLKLVSCTLGDFRYSTNNEEVINLSIVPISNTEQVHIEAQGIPNDLYYRMDATLQSGKILNWDVASVLLKDARSARDYNIGVKAFQTQNNQKVIIPVVTSSKFLPPVSKDSIVMKFINTTRTSSFQYQLDDGPLHLLKGSFPPGRLISFKLGANIQKGIHVLKLNITYDKNKTIGVQFKIQY
jgi:hypothetical protein